MYEYPYLINPQLALVLFVFQYLLSFLREQNFGNGKIQWLQNAVIRFASHLGLSDHGTPYRGVPFILASGWRCVRDDDKTSPQNFKPLLTVYASNSDSFSARESPKVEISPKVFGNHGQSLQNLRIIVKIRRNSNDYKIK